MPAAGTSISNPTTSTCRASLAPVLNSFLLILPPNHMHVCCKACRLVSHGTLPWKGWAQTLVTHPGCSTARCLCLVSILHPVKNAHSVFYLAPSSPCRSITPAILSLVKGLGGGLPSGCLLTSAFNPETRAHYTLSETQDARL